MTTAAQSALERYRATRQLEREWEGELPLAQAAALEALCAQGRMTCRELAKHLLASPSNLTRILDGLVARGLIARGRDMHDRRKVYVWAP